MINKGYKNGFIAVMIVCLLLLAAGSSFDWQITDFLYRPANPVCIVFEAFSSFPVYFFRPVLGACLMRKSKSNIPVFTVGSVLLICPCAYYIYGAFTAMAERGLVKDVNPYICGILSGLASVAIFFGVRSLSKRSMRKVQAMCAFAFAYMFCYLAVFFTLKVAFGRDRYEDIIGGGDFVFTKWYLPEFFTSGSSFPSGHVGAAMGVMTLLLLPYLFEKLKNKKYLIFLRCYAYVFVTAFTRLVMGRHFLSDVSMAVLLMTAIFMILTPFFERVYRKELVTYRKKKKRPRQNPDRVLY